MPFHFWAFPVILVAAVGIALFIIATSETPQGSSYSPPMNDNSPSVSNRDNTWKRRRRADSRDCCPICQEVLISLKNSITLNCEHEFHEDCINKWKRCKNSCPVCRVEIW